MEMYHFMVNFFREGGFFLYPLAIIFVVGVAIAIERTVTLTKEMVLNRNLWNEVTPLISAGNFKQVVAITSKSSAISLIYPTRWHTYLPTPPKHKESPTTPSQRSESATSLLQQKPATGGVCGKGMPR